MNWQTGMILICLVVIAVYLIAVISNRLCGRFNRKLVPETLSTRKRKITERAYRSSYDRRYL